MPLASRITDEHACPAHGINPVVTGCPTVIVSSQLAARVGDLLVCGDVIAEGSPTVIIGGQHAARIGDPTAHTGRLIQGTPTVIIGATAQVGALKAAAASGAPFVAKCPNDGGGT
jgi:uncharacterized Zn-binding protein involved in type VI secretion